MVVLALAAVILGIGVPIFSDFQRNSRLTVAANDVLGMVITPRAEALRRQIAISCAQPRTGGRRRHLRRCAGLDRVRRPEYRLQRDAERRDRISGTRVDTDVNAGLRTPICISFATTGFKRVVAGQPTTSRMMFCDERGNTPRLPSGQRIGRARRRSSAHRARRRGEVHSMKWRLERRRRSGGVSHEHAQESRAWPVCTGNAASRWSKRWWRWW